MPADSSPAVLKIRADRIRLQREVADALKASSDAYLTYVKPHAADARMVVGAPMAKGKDKRNPSATKVLSMDVAEKLDRTTATGAFEYGRALMASWDEVIRRKRSQLKAVEENLRKALEEQARASGPFSDAIGRAWGDGEGRPGPSDPGAVLASTGLPHGAAERLDMLRRLVHDARGGLGGVQEGI